MNRRGFLKTGSIAAVAGMGHGASAQAASTAGRRKRGGLKYLVLSCDGGGMRGYLSSLLLQRLSEDLGILGANNSNVDLYAGTSTGGLIALGLAAGKSVESVVALYQEDGPEIFKPLMAQAGCVLPLPHALKGSAVDVKEFWQVLFDDIGRVSVRKVIENFIPGNPTLTALQNRVLVTTFQLAAQVQGVTSWKPLVIDNLASSTTGTTSLYDAALSTSAAPVYFPPYQHPSFGWCSDGGLFANNPAPQAIARAIETGIPLTEISLLSIGTGFTSASLPVTEDKRLCYGLQKWASFEQTESTPPFPLLNGIMDGVAATNDYVCSQLLGSRYLRINPVLPEAVALDDYRPQTLEMFQNTAASLFQSPEWVAITKWVTTYFQK